MLSVPIAIERITEENADEHVAECKRAHADRVFFCMFKSFIDKPEALEPQLKKVVFLREKFHANGIEVGVWLDDLGHGASELGYKQAKKLYAPLEGAIGKSKDSYCPLDADFVAAYKKYLKRIAETRPDVIMFDDDFRFSVRNYGIGCFCKLHREALAAKIGKKYGKLALFKKVFEGSPNPVRQAWLAVSGESLLGFARAMRETIDSVDKNIRLGCCMCLDTLDLAGTDALTLAKAFAGETKPFFRTSGAPYWHVKAPQWGDSRSVSEYTRQEAAWFDGEEVEIFSEGDVFPRPRYNVPANYLECFDAYLQADGKSGILKYMFDYRYELGYETGYLDHHAKNYEVVKQIAEAFRGKKQTGIELYEPMKRISLWNIEKVIAPIRDFLPPPPSGKTARFFDSLIRRPYYRINGYFEKNQWLPTISFGRAQRLFSANGLPTLYTEGEGAAVCFGENARSLPESYLSRGLILDAAAANVLTERGVDVGLVSSEIIYPSAEEFACGADTEIGKCRYLRALTCSPKAKVVSRYLPDNRPASYLYVNDAGQRFFVLGLDGFLAPLTGDESYFSHYYRLRSLTDGYTQLNGKPPVASSEKNPGLALLCARNEKEYAVGLFNFYIDGIVQPKINVSVPIKDIRFINCTGSVTENGVKLDGEIPPFGFAAFTFTES